MALTYDSIATTTLGSAASTIEFSNISGSYTDLVFVIQLASTSSDHIFVRFNGNTASNYSATRLTGTGTSALSDRYTSQTEAPLTWYAWPISTIGNTMTIFQIMNYSNSTTNKTYLSRSSKAAAGTDAIVGLWRSTAAITSVTFATTTFGTSSSISANSTISLFGIKAA